MKKFNTSDPESGSDENDSDIESQKGIKPLVNALKNHENHKFDLNDNFFLAMNGEIELLDKILPEDIDRYDSHNFSVLHYATRFQHYELAIGLIEKGAKINHKDKEKTPFHLVCEHSKLLNGDQSSKLLEDLLMKMIETDRTILFCKDKYDYTGLHYAASNGNCNVVQNILKASKKGLVVNCQNLEGDTAIMMAAGNGHMKVVQELINAKADINLSNKKRQNIFHVAIARDQPKILQIIIHIIKLPKLLNMVDETEGSPLHIAAKQNDNTECLEILLSSEHMNKELAVQKFGEDEDSPCHVAAKHGCIDVLEMFLNKYPFAAQIQNNKNLTPLQVSAASGKLECMNLLLNWEADFNDCMDQRGKMLIAAAENGHALVVKKLLDGQTDVVQEALMAAIRNRHTSVIETIIDTGSHSLYKAALEEKEMIHKGTENTIGKINEPMCKEDKIDKDTRIKKPATSPMRELIKHFPKLAEKVLFKCITHKEDQLVIDTEVIEVKCFKTETGLFSCVDTYVDYNNHPMMIMAKERHENLLKHPVSLIWTKHQWTSYGRTIFFIETMLYIFFLISVSIYSSTTLTTVSFEKAMNEMQYFTKTDLFQARTSSDVSWVLTLISTLLCLLYELFQLSSRKLNYFYHVSSYVDLSLCFTTLLLLASPDINITMMYCSSHQCWKWPTAAILMTGAWLNFLRYLKFFSFFGIFLIMFVKILKTVMKLSLMLSVFILAFSFSFHITLADQDPFAGFGWAYLKTAVMSVGEFEFDEIFRGDHKVAFHTVTVVTFMVLILVMTIVLMNMLIGIAVDNISKVQADAELERVCSQIALVLEMRRPWYKRVSSFTNILVEIMCWKKRNKSNQDNTISININEINDNPSNSKIKKLYPRIRRHIGMVNFMSNENVRKSYFEKKQHQNPRLSEVESLQEAVTFLRHELKNDIQSLKDSNAKLSEIDSLQEAVACLRGEFKDEIKVLKGLSTN